MDNQEQQKETPIINQPTENHQGANNSTDNDKLWGIIAYLIFFLPLIVIKDRSAFLNFHINQGLTLFIVGLIGSVILSMPFNGLIMILGQIWNILIIILVIVGIINVTKKEMKPLPLIGNLFSIIK
ncbi:MAG: hypothetical protein PHN69_01040 [Candidatus Pacebacteria bacterium]|nr:hypothetical protein [Candidatus Paceibacterota bacterium]